MATYYANNGGKTTAAPRRYNPTGETYVYFYWTVGVALATSDIVILAQIPTDLSIVSPTDPRATYVTGVHFQISQVDSGTALVFSLGDSAGTILTGLTGGRAAGPFVVSNMDCSVVNPAAASVAAAAAATNVSGHWGAGIWPRRYTGVPTSPADIRMTVTTGVTGLQASGVIQGYVRYTTAEAF